MRAKDLIKQLQKLVHENGNVPVMCVDENVGKLRPVTKAVYTMVENCLIILGPS